MIVHALRHTHPLKHLLKVSCLARSSFYYHLKQVGRDKYHAVKQQIQAIFHRHKGRYGYRRIALALRQLGHQINHKTVHKLMQELGLQSSVRPKKRKHQRYTGRVGEVADNLINQNFTAHKPNEKWATDVTEFKVGNEKLYLSPILDMFNGEIISYSLNRRPVFTMVMDMLADGLSRLTNTEKPIFHSDQGWQYQMQKYQDKVKQASITQSMSRKGNCLDNAMMESFFAVLKTECFYTQTFNSIEELKKQIHDYIHYYNHDRIKVKLGGLSPIQYRLQFQKSESTV